jgi:hypothetical protein
VEKHKQTLDDQASVIKRLKKDLHMCEQKLKAERTMNSTLYKQLTKQTEALAKLAGLPAISDLQDKLKKE